MASGRIKRRLAAILALDVVEYSRLMRNDEAATLEALLNVHRTVVKPSVDEHDGRIVKLMGDGALSEFPSVVDAVECGLKIQKSIAELNQGVSDERAIRLRIGINLGDVIVEGADIYGDGVSA